MDNVSFKQCGVRVQRQRAHCKLPVAPEMEEVDWMSLCRHCEVIRCAQRSAFVGPASLETWMLTTVGKGLALPCFGELFEAGRNEQRRHHHWRTPFNNNR